MRALKTEWGERWATGEGGLGGERWAVLIRKDYRPAALAMVPVCAVT